MRKRILIIQFLALFFVSKSNAQTSEDFEKIALLLGDALFFSEQYILPATDATIYQSSSNWILSPKRGENREVILGFHAVPKNDSDFSFFEMEGATSVVVSRAMGNSNQFYLVGEIDGEKCF